MGAPVWPPNPHTLGAPRGSRGAARSPTFLERETGSEPKLRTILPKNSGGKFDTDKFMEGFTSEIAQIQLQALFGKDRGAEQPLFTSNLVPSSDGLHWTVASNKRCNT